MNIAVFVSVWSAKTSSIDLHSYFMGKPLTFLKAQADVNCVEVYLPESGNVPVLDDVPPPAMIIQIDMGTAASAEALVIASGFKELFLNKSTYPAPVQQLNLEAFETVCYDLPGYTSPPPRTAPVSLVVRYYGPVADVSRFVDIYTKAHPPLLARFPNIRNVLCYLPLKWRTNKQVTDSRAIIGNEVVFDDLDALNRALASDVCELVVEDANNFPSFGYSSHHAMCRQCVYKRDEK